jgi:hypothetical protein
MHCKKGYRFPVPSRDVTNLILPWPGMIKLFPARESLVGDITTEEGKNDNLFMQCKVDSGIGLMSTLA